MAKNRLKAKFAQLLRLGRLHGKTKAWPREKERRAYQRLMVESVAVSIGEEPEFKVIDMSPAGVALLSNHPFPTGETLKLSLGVAGSTEARVIACTMDEPATDHLDAQFRIHCEFDDENAGMKLLTDSAESKR